jgi:23S rRNA pseudouridine2604 synthase
MAEDARMRLNKFISESGRCSRREADEWIAAGRVRVNGRPVAVGAVIEDGDEVAVDGERLHPRGGARAKPRVYIALNKPVGITCTTESDVEGNIVAFVDYPERIFPIGRLDKDSDGLILLTNDGDIVNPILRAENRHEKEYIVSINRPVTAEFCARMSRGVDIGGGAITRPCRVQKLSKFVFRIVLTQGLNRQIRRMCEAHGYWVRALTRVRIVNVQLGHLKPGQWRKLTAEEVAGLVPKPGEAGQAATRAPATPPGSVRIGPRGARAAGAVPRPPRPPRTAREEASARAAAGRAGPRAPAKASPARDRRAYAPPKSVQTQPTGPRQPSRSAVSAKSGPRPATARPTRRPGVRPARPGPRSR